MCRLQVKTKVPYEAYLIERISLHMMLSIRQRAKLCVMERFRVNIGTVHVVSFHFARRCPA